MVPAKRGLPSLIGFRTGVLFADFVHAPADFLGRGVGEVRCLDLLTQQLLVDEAIERSLALAQAQLLNWFACGKSFEVESVFPVALQDDVTVYRSHDSIDHVTGTDGPGGEDQ